MTRNVIGLSGELQVRLLRGNEVHEGTHFLGRFAGLERHPGGTARDAGARGWATRVGHGHPVELVCDIALQAVNLPATRQHHHHVAINEFANRVGVGGSTRTGPDFTQHAAVFVPADEFGDGGFVAIVDHRITLAIKNLGAVADSRAGETVARAVPGQCAFGRGGFGHLASGFDPLIPGCFGAGHRHLGLLEQCLVDERSSHGQLRHEAIDALVLRRWAQPKRRCTEVGIPVFAVFDVGRNIHVVLGQTTQVCHTRDVGALTGRQLHWQLLHNGFVGYGVDDYLGAGVRSLEALGLLDRDVALHAVLVTHDADFTRLSQCGGKSQACKQGHRTDLDSFHKYLLVVNCGKYIAKGQKRAYRLYE